MSKRILDYDPFSGITRYFDYIESEDRVVIESVQDIEPILDANKARQNDTELTRKGIKNGWWMYASIPNIIQEKWLSEHGVNIWDKNAWDKNGPVWRLLNDPRYRYLKTTSKYHAG